MTDALAQDLLIYRPLCWFWRCRMSSPRFHRWRNKKVVAFVKKIEAAHIVSEEICCTLIEIIR